MNMKEGGLAVGFPDRLQPGRELSLTFCWVVGMAFRGGRVPSSDVAIMVAELHENVAPPRIMRLGLEPPVLGENCLSVGYPKIEVGRAVETKATGSVALCTSRGRIEEVHESRRDSSLVTFPSFRTGALYPPGMSGGPVISVAGRVIGVVSTGMTASDGIPATAYCALSAGLIELEIPVEGTRMTVAEAIENGSVPVLGDESTPATTLTRDDDSIATITWNPVIEQRHPLPLGSVNIAGPGWGVVVGGSTCGY